MPTALPVIRGTSTALYPFTQTYVCRTGRLDAQSSTVTRWPTGYPTVTFQLPYDTLKQADKNTLKAALVSAKGQFETDLTATTDITYSNLSLDEDEFSGIESTSTMYGVKWTVTQTLPQNLSPGSSGGAYPTLSTGAISQLPYTQKKRFQTIVSKVASGPKYTYAEFAGGLSGFPNDGLMAWEFSERNLLDSEVTTKVQHFLNQWGDCYSFSFTDEDGTTYSHVYYGSPELTITRNRPNSSSVRTMLIQMS